LITGGTGSFGNAVMERFIKSDIKEIRIFSRDEKKQDDIRKKFNNPKLKFYLGDVREFNSINNALTNVDFVFHAAALKQVPSCEFFPIEAVKTNIIGTDNVLEAAIQNNVKKVVCLSTDKAAYPINAMGISKAMMEKIAVAKSRNASESETIISITRYGNVMASRGSVIPLFIDQILNNEDLTITEPQMTRFLMDLDEAVDLVLYAFENASQGDLMIQKSPSCTIETLAKALIELFNSKSKISNIGVRHGEKLYETLMTKEEFAVASDLGNYYRVPSDHRDLNYSKYTNEGGVNLLSNKEYNSHNTNILNTNEVKNKLLKLEYLKKYEHILKL
jgi:UDP-N-acetylglucosamine 4,6-dehydratase